MYFKKTIGELGEELAIEYLEKNHITIIERNFYTRFGEIDIIAQNKDEIVFIEVKTRRSIKYGLPSEAVTYSKIKHMVKAAKYYLYKTKQENHNVRFDAIEVYLGKNKYAINHIKNIEI